MPSACLNLSRALAKMISESFKRRNRSFLSIAPARAPAHRTNPIPPPHPETGLTKQGRFRDHYLASSVARLTRQTGIVNLFTATPAEGTGFRDTTDVSLTRRIAHQNKPYLTYMAEGVVLFQASTGES